jgi:hypothetical protein
MKWCGCTRSWVAASFYRPSGGNLQTCCIVLYMVTAYRRTVPLSWRLSWWILVYGAAWRRIPASAGGVATPVLVCGQIWGWSWPASNLVVARTLIQVCAHACSRVLLREELWMHRRRRVVSLRRRVPQRWGWLHSAGMAAQCRRMVDKMCSTRYAPRCCRIVRLVAARTLFEGAPMPFPGARRESRTGAGDTTFWNDTSLFAQCLCTARTTPTMTA